MDGKSGDEMGEVGVGDPPAQKGDERDDDDGGDVEQR